MSITFQVASERILSDGELPLFANFANSNAYDLMRMVGLPVDYTGCVGTAGLPGVMRAIIKARNLQSKRTPYLREYSKQRKPGQCTVIDCGNNDEQIIRRLCHLEKVVLECIRQNKPLVWG